MDRRDERKRKPGRDANGYGHPGIGTPESSGVNRATPAFPRIFPPARKIAGLLIAVAFWLLVACVPRIAAQADPAETYAGFEGQNVSKVQISANPKVALEQIQPLIKQKA